jgi:hypothetical protein
LQTYTLSVAHNGPVIISLSNGVTAATHGLQFSRAQPSVRLSGKSLFVNAPESCIIRLIDVSGRAIMQKSSAAGEREFALGRLNPGMYVLRLSEKTGKEIAQKILVQN